jgi:hypothetical protein
MGREFAMKTAIALLFLLAMPASAALVEQDLFSTGDALLTLDDVSGLRWLDLTETTGLSMDDIVADVGGWSSMGFRHATGGELCDLISRNFWAPPGSCPTQNGWGGDDGGAAATSFQDYLGITYKWPNGVDFTTLGFFEDSTPGNPRVGGAAVYMYGFGASHFGVVSDTERYRDTAIPTWGHFLVLIPEPSTALLFAFGVVALAAKRKSDRVQQGALSDTLPPHNGQGTEAEDQQAAGCGLGDKELRLCKCPRTWSRTAWACLKLSDEAAAEITDQGGGVRGQEVRQTADASGEVARRSGTG